MGFGLIVRGTEAHESIGLGLTNSWDSASIMPWKRLRGRPRVIAFAGLGLSTDESLGLRLTAPMRSRDSDSALANL